MGRTAPKLLASLIPALLALACADRQVRLTSDPVDFGYSMGTTSLRLRSHRGEPVVLALIRTSEVVSQMFLMELALAHEDLEDRGVSLLVLSVEESERPFLAHVVAFHELPFDIGLAERRVVLGESQLGVLPMIPVTFLVDEDGEIEGARAGLVGRADLLTAVRFYLRR